MNKYVWSFFREVAIVSDVFKVIGSSFQTLGAGTEKACLPKLRFVLDTISCKIYDLSSLGIFERCRRLAKCQCHARQFCTRWSLAKSLLAMLFSSEYSRWLLSNAVGIVLAEDIDM